MRPLTLAIVATCAASVAWAQAIDENALFGDSAMVVEDSNALGKPSAHIIPGTESMQVPASDASKQGLKLSGQVSGQASETYFRDAKGEPSFGNDGGPSPSLSTQTVGVLYFDARSSDDTKAFAAFEANYVSTDSVKTHANLRELFLDFNLKRHLYLRFGKQVLQWGRCYFWNPSDLVNVEHKGFVQRAGALEGTYGLRAHVPVGTKANFYSFIDAQDAKQLNQLKGSFKAEALFGGTETSVSLWKRADLDPVYAWDISTALGKWNIASEAAFFPDGFLQRYNIHNDTLFTQGSKAFTPRIAFTLGRSFEVLDVADRLTVQYEMYYNGLGYTENPRDDHSYRPWAASVKTPGTLSTLIPAGMSMSQLGAGPKWLWLIAQDQTSPYSSGRYYAAFFTSFSRFIVQDLTISCNGLMNLTDKSYVFSGSLGYATLQNLTLQLTGIAFGGGFPGEMTGYELKGAVPPQYSAYLPNQTTSPRMQVQGSATFTF